MEQFSTKLRMYDRHTTNGCCFSFILHNYNFTITRKLSSVFRSNVSSQIRFEAARVLRRAKSDIKIEEMERDIQLAGSEERRGKLILRFQLMAFG